VGVASISSGLLIALDDVHSQLPILRRLVRRTEIAMTCMVRVLTIVASFALLLNITPGRGQTPVCAYPGCNPTRSTQNFNTAGGTAALINVVELTGVGFSNTAFGWFAMQREHPPLDTLQA
jgi:hypothetical protein